MAAPQTPPTGSALTRDLILYTLGRLALVAVLTVPMVLAGIPLLVSVLFALVIALPLSLVVFRPLRLRVAAGMSAAAERRRAERARLREELRGGPGEG